MNFNLPNTYLEEESKINMVKLNILLAPVINKYYLISIHKTIILKCIYISETLQVQHYSPLKNEILNY